MSKPKPHLFHETFQTFIHKELLYFVYDSDLGIVSQMTDVTGNLC